MRLVADLALRSTYERPPFNDTDFRWAISYLIDRDQLIDVGWVGRQPRRCRCRCRSTRAASRIFDAAKPLLEKYPTNEFNPKKGDELLDGKGWKKDGDGMYSDATGKPFKLEIISFFDFPSVGPVLVELLKRQGINATYVQPPDMFDRFSQGDYNGAIFGHGGSVSGSLRHAAALPDRLGGDPRRPPRQPLALEERRLRQDRRRGRHDAAGPTRPR